MHEDQALLALTYHALWHHNKRKVRLAVILSTVVMNKASRSDYEVDENLLQIGPIRIRRFAPHNEEDWMTEKVA